MINVRAAALQCDMECYERAAQAPDSSTGPPDRPDLEAMRVAIPQFGCSNPRCSYTVLSDWDASCIELCMRTAQKAGTLMYAPCVQVHKHIGHQRGCAGNQGMLSLPGGMLLQPRLPEAALARPQGGV